MRTAKSAEMPQQQPQDVDVRVRMVESAIVLFAKKGVDDVSLRELTTHAGTSLAAVNYHFGTKEALAKIVFEELSKRVNQRRLSSLSEIEARCIALGKPPALEDVISSFIEPYVGSSHGDEGLLLARLILRHRTTPSDMTSKLMRKHFDPMAKRYIAAFAAACPDVPAEEFPWRYTFMVSTVVLTITDRTKDSRLAKLSDGQADPTDARALAGALMRFLIGGMRAPFLKT
ncbi:MAG: TetR family transcriptional regulator [Proteobacteria bacterium]|nr:TetR family transcriptional regulator [Pseudomonadota bacterium]